MTRSRPLVLLILAACAADQAPTPAAPAAPSADWYSAASAAIAADARAFRASDLGFTAVTPRVDAQVTPDGLTIATPGGAPFHLAATAWGRPARLAPLPLAPPTLGACAGQGDGCTRRVERPFEGLTEWWVSRDVGVEQGWDIEQAPDGEGPLTLVVSVDDALAAPSGDGVLVTDADGHAWTYGAATAWDADGAPLPTTLTVDDDGAIIVTVDDTSATFPVTVDPILSTANYTLSIDGSGANPIFGGKIHSVASADVNGDGYDDAVVSAWSYSSGASSGIGAAYVFLGSAAGLATTYTTRLDGTGRRGNFGYQVASAGDVDGDGDDDVLIEASATTSAIPVILLYRGTSTGLETSPAAELTLTSTSSFTLPAFAGLGDVNGDGYDDIAVGDYLASAAGEVRVYTGSASGLTAALTLTAPSGAANLGDAVTGGDVNHDGYADLVVTSRLSGRLFTYFGASTGLATTPASTSTISTSTSTLGLVCADVDGDGYADVLQSDPTGTRAARWYRGSSTGLGATYSASISGPPSYSFGASAVAGDVNGDGKADLLLSSSTSSGTGYSVGVWLGTSTGPAATSSTTLSAGFPSSGDYNGDGYADALAGTDTNTALLYLGSAAGLSSTVTATLHGQDRANFGAAVASDGDVNGDGYDDIAVTSTVSDQVYVFLGSATGPSTTYATLLTGTQTNTDFGSALSFGPDVNNDGYDDLLVGESDTVGANKGRVYVYLGSASGLATTPVATLSTGAANDSFGSVVAGLGDVNRDGYDDIAVGAGNASGARGTLYVYAGNATGVATSPTTTITGTSMSGYLGGSVAGAGDVNGDGYGDMIVGAPYAGTVGAAYVYHGSATGLSTTAARTFTGSTAYTGFGATVEGAVDVNGDGYDDVLVAEPYDTASHGTVRVYFGSSSGVASTASQTIHGGTEYGAFGHVLVGIGDTDSDGYDDVALYGSTTMYSAHVYSGSAAGLNESTVVTLSGAASDQFANAMCGGGDVDGDGVPELAVGASAAAPAGAVYLYAGTSTSGDADADGDGYPASADCDDHDATVSPAAAEVCDASHTDEDCDGLADDDDPSTTGLLLFYTDHDGDTYGDAASSISACVAPTGTVSNATDCDDGRADVRPGGAEVCDALDADEDCDGLVDDADPTVSGRGTWHTDADTDGYGDPSTYTVTCDAPAGSVADATDCDDADASAHPGATEVCDPTATDEDCDGLADDADSSTSVDSKSLWYADADTDGYGNALSNVAACAQPAGYAADATDCDDTDAAANPGAAEVCDGADTDEDCDGLADDADVSATGQTDWHADADTDGYGSPTVTLARCDTPTGYLVDATDCDDAAASVNPGASEQCDPADVDEDCDGLADDADPSAVGLATYYLDGDADGFGAAATPVTACDVPSGASIAGTDCNDADAGINPDAIEVCDTGRTDEDCDGLVDDEDTVSGTTTWYTDADGDGYGDASAPVAACLVPEGAVANADDCDDADAAVHPDAVETCADGRDTNCDGSTGGDDADGDGVSACDDCDDTDPAVTGPVPTWRDADADGYGTGATVDACPGAAGYADTNGDCNDADPAYHPYAPETDCADPSDYNCDGSSGGTDADGDGYAACEDCDDGEAAKNPGAAEVCDAGNVDEDCDGLADDADGAVDISTLSIWYADTDSDGYGDSTALRPACDAPEGYVDNGEDCDDTDPSAYPAAPEVAGDGIDQDCDGADLPADTGETGNDTGGDTAEDTAGDTAEDTADSGDSGDSEGDTAGKDDGGGCGCGTGGDASAWPLVLGILAIRRRRRG